MSKTRNTIFNLVLSGITITPALAETMIEEIIVTAQKREQPLQETPIAISVMSAQDLKTLGISSLNALMDGNIPSLMVNPNGSTPSSLTVTIRGNGPIDVGQPTRQSGVAIYTDGIYLGRAQGLSMDLLDLERIEVLRGPQGTLFGRNSTNGAINLTSYKPTGEFGFDQSVLTGSYDELKTVTRVNLPSFGGLNAKIDYVHSERDGWVKNTLHSQADYNEYNKDAGKISVNWEINENVELDYRYDKSDIRAAQVYLQLYDDVFDLFPTENETSRETKTRYQLVLDPTTVDVNGHSFIVQWQISDAIAVKALSATRELEEDGFNNYGGVLDTVAANNTGLVLDEDIEQEQYSQEFQLIGQYDKFEWVTGLYYWKETSDFNAGVLNTLDVNYSPIDPPTVQDPQQLTTIDTESYALYGQGTLSLTSNINITAGVRYTEDKNEAVRAQVPAPSLKSDNVDTVLSIDYEWLEGITTYVKWATAYKSGGYNARSVEFLPFQEENSATWELGLKSVLFDQRMRFNVAAFSSTIDDKQFDFINPSNPRITDTLSAEKEVDISGLEVDIEAVLSANLALSFQYAYLDGDMPIQPHPLGGDSAQFALTQTPKHRGTLSMDYRVLNTEMADVLFNLNITSTDSYSNLTTPDSEGDSHTLVNARFTFDNIKFGSEGDFSLAIWGKNLTDESYSRLRYPIGQPTAFVLQSFGTPRTAGLELSYNY